MTIYPYDGQTWVKAWCDGWVVWDGPATEYMRGMTFDKVEVREPCEYSNYYNLVHKRRERENKQD